VTLAGSKTDSLKYIYCEKSITYIAVLLYSGYVMEKAHKSNVSNGLDTSQHRAVLEF
jgi:hypothetical protein